MRYLYSGLNRTICDVLQEMRKCSETRNYSYLEALIEEAQSMGNRMEAALSDVKDVKSLREEKKDLKRKLSALHRKLKKNEEVDNL